MIDPVQTLLIAVITVLTALLVVIGIQVVNILREFRQTVRKINEILDQIGAISKNMSQPLSGLANFSSGIQAGVKIVRLFTQVFKKKRKKNE